MSIFPISAFDDNYIWCVHNNNHCVVVDPGDATPVLEYCESNQLTLDAILVTHHHWDHTSGIDTLLTSYPNIPVYGPQNPDITQISHRLQDGEQIQLAQLGLDFSVIEVPGHTLDHIAYYGDTGLFCGDTLFSAGCGRLFEGTPQQMFTSLQKLAALPSETLVYCTHEYTMANVAFAEAAEPNNQDIIEYKNWVDRQRSNNVPTLPSSIATEKKINPFLRCDSQPLIARINQQQGAELTSPEAVFASLRRWKDNF